MEYDNAQHLIIFEIFRKKLYEALNSTERFSVVLFEIPNGLGVNNTSSLKYLTQRVKIKLKYYPYSESLPDLKELSEKHNNNIKNCGVSANFLEKHKQ